MEVRKQNPDLYLELSINDMKAIDGGILAPFLAIGAACAAGLAIFEAGECVGKTIYYLTH